MNKALLKSTARNLDDWMTKSMQQTVTIDQKLDLIMFSLKDICVALCTDGSQESIDQFYAPDPAMGDQIDSPHRPKNPQKKVTSPVHKYVDNQRKGIRMFEVDWTRVPVPYMTDGLKLYVERGILPGHFLIALLSNDLLEAYRRADDNNTAAMRDWAAFLHNQLPRECWGSPDKVLAWCKTGGLVGQGFSTSPAD